MFKGLKLYITLNEFAFFVPCFNTTINELINVSDKDDVTYESYYNFMSDYNTIKKMETLLKENERFCRFDEMEEEDFGGNSINNNNNINQSPEDIIRKVVMI